MTFYGKGKRLLITGASGLLGSNLIRLASNRYQVVGILHGKQAVAVQQNNAVKQPGFETITIDLCQPGAVEQVFEQAHPEIVIHCAAMTDVDRCEEFPDEAARMNTDLPAQLAHIASVNKAQFLHISTDSVFDGETGGYSEEDQPRAINVYSRTKLDGERRVADKYADALIARVNFFGWSWHGRRSLAEWFFYNLKAGKTMLGFTDLTFCPLLVNDMGEILLRMIDQDMRGLYHVVSSESQNKFDFGRMIAKEFGYDEELITPASYLSTSLKAPRSRMLTLSCAKLEMALGEKMPGQAEAVKRFATLHHQGYPQVLQSMFARPDPQLGMERTVLAG